MLKFGSSDPTPLSGYPAKTCAPYSADKAAENILVLIEGAASQRMTMTQGINPYMGTICIWFGSGVTR